MAKEADKEEIREETHEFQDSEQEELEEEEEEEEKEEEVWQKRVDGLFSCQWNEPYRHNFRELTVAQ